jgi:hypothetical protein
VTAGRRAAAPSRSRSVMRGRLLLCVCVCARMRIAAVVARRHRAAATARAHANERAHPHAHTMAAHARARGPVWQRVTAAATYIRRHTTAHLYAGAAQRRRIARRRAETAGGRTADRQPARPTPREHRSTYRNGNISCIPARTGRPEPERPPAARGAETACTFILPGTHRFPFRLPKLSPARPSEY